MTAALILIDIQMGFKDPFWGARNNPDAEIKAAELLTHWRAKGGLVCHIQHVSVEPGSVLGPGPGIAFMPEVAPIDGEAVFQKNVNSGFIGTNLESHLRAQGVSHIVTCGLTTPHCVSTTSRMGANLGFQVTLAHDACATFAQNCDSSWSAAAPEMTPEQIHTSAVSHLHGEFVTARSCVDILAELP